MEAGKMRKYLLGPRIQDVPPVFPAAVFHRYFPLSAKIETLASQGLGLFVSKDQDF